jgi:hypothetical protein
VQNLRGRSDERNPHLRRRGIFPFGLAEVSLETNVEAMKSVACTSQRSVSKRRCPISITAAIPSASPIE